MNYQNKLTIFKKNNVSSIFSSVVFRSKKFSKWLLIWAIGVAIVSGIFTIGYRYHEYQELKNNPEYAAAKELNTILNHLAKFMILPADEIPTLATITDSEKARQQTFLKNTENGDKLIIFAKNRKAILYRPNSRKIIEFGPLLVE